MKKSLIAIVVTAVFVITASVFLFALTKHYIQPQDEVVKPIQLISQDLQPFSVVVANPGADVHIEQADKYAIAVETEPDKDKPAAVFVQRNDTLIIEKGARVYVNCTDLTSIISNKSFWMGVHILSVPELEIKMKGGTLRYTIGNQNSTVGSMKVQLTDSAKFYLQRTEVENLQLSMKGASYAELFTTVKNLNLELFDHSHLRTADKMEAIQIKKDSSVRLELFNK